MPDPAPPPARRLADAASRALAIYRHVSSSVLLVEAANTGFLKHPDWPEAYRELKAALLEAAPAGAEQDELLADTQHPQLNSLVLLSSIHRYKRAVKGAPEMLAAAGVALSRELEAYVDHMEGRDAVEDATPEEEPELPMTEKEVTDLAMELIAEHDERGSPLWPRAIQLMRLLTKGDHGYCAMALIFSRCLVTTAHMAAIQSDNSIPACIQLHQSLLEQTDSELPDGVLDAICS